MEVNVAKRKRSDLAGQRADHHDIRAGFSETDSLPTNQEVVVYNARRHGADAAARTRGKCRVGGATRISIRTDSPVRKESESTAIYKPGPRGSVPCRPVSISRDLNVFRALPDQDSYKADDATPADFHCLSAQPAACPR